MILAGDIGGTHARLALFGPDAKRVVRHETYDSRAFKNLEAVLTTFLGAKPPRIAAATFGIAGPVIDQRCTATNLPWIVDARVIARKFNIKRATLINDLVALALGALIAPRSKIRTLSGGALPKKKGANLAILAAGTGLGEAALIWDGQGFVPMATEGGHTDFAGRSEVEMELATYLTSRYGRATYERVLSGPGLGNIYDFFHDKKAMGDTPENTRRLAEAKDRNAEIGKLAASGQSATAARAIDTFVSVYGAEAGNLALKTFAVGGVFIAGGIAISLADTLASGEFVRSMRAKDPMSGLLERIPVALVLDSTIGISGAAFHALTSR